MHVLSCCLAQKIIFSLTLSSSLWLHKLSIVTANNTKCQELFVNQLIYDSFKSISEDYPRPTITCPQNNIGTLLFLYFFTIFTTSTYVVLGKYSLRVNELEIDKSSWVKRNRYLYSNLSIIMQTMNVSFTCQWEVLQSGLLLSLAKFNGICLSSSRRKFTLKRL